MDPRPVKEAKQAGWNPSSFGLDKQGISVREAYWNLSAGELYEHVVRRNEGQVAHLGALVVNTGQHTGRSPNDKFVVREPSSENHVWWGKVNRSFESANFDRLYHKVLAHLQNREVYVQDCFAGADPTYRVPIRVITEYAWHSLFARNMFVRPDPATSSQHVPEYTILCCPKFQAIPELTEKL